MISAIKRRYAEIEARERANEARERANEAWGAEGGDAEHSRLAKPDWDSPMAVHRSGRKRARRPPAGEGVTARRVVNFLNFRVRTGRSAPPAPGQHRAPGGSAIGPPS